jgi:hypothetical protein
MSEQMHLLDNLDNTDAGYDHARFLLDAQTRRIGLAGLARARAALAAAVREHDHLHEAAA